MRISKQASCISFAVVTVAATISMSARAEYRCATPQQLTPAERRACELAHQDSPDRLIHFVNRTKPIYQLYANDYVSKADVERWELAKRRGGSDSPTIAKAKGEAKGTLKAD